MTPAASFSERLDRVMSRVTAACTRVGRSPESVTLVAVTKTKPVSAVREAAETGIRVFGENRVQEAATKIPELGVPGAEWHLIGHLQGNKAKQAVQLFDMIESVDSIELARRLDRFAGEAGKRMPILLQVHLGDEESKFGIDPAELPDLYARAVALSNLDVQGLMAIPPYLPDPEQVRSYFRQLRGLRDELAERFPARSPLPHLSMGMSHDFEVAIEEGATMVRVGTALFGER